VALTFLSVIPDSTDGNVGAMGKPLVSRAKAAYN
jgi:hypothetical protein